MLAALLISACSDGKPYVPGDGGSGGSAGSGGRGGAGGTKSTGGAGGATGGIGGQAGGTGGHGGGVAGAGAGGSSVGTAGTTGTAGAGASTGGSSGGATGGSGATGGAIAGTSGSAGAGGRGGTSQTAGTGGNGGTAGTAGTGGTTPPCTGTTKHMCPSGCVDNSSVMSCGSRCDSCPVPAGGAATCDGTSCGFTCSGSTPKQCLTAGICIASTGCCSNTDCPTNAGGQAGTCDSGTHMCNYACTGSTKACTSGSTTVCIPSTGCCSNSDCTGTCMMCDTANHTCAPVKGTDDPNGRCTGTCDASGACKAKQGQACSTGTDCITTFCADRICCNSACTGSCEFCNGAVPGTCGFVSGAPKTGHAACGGSGSCAGTCDGTKATCKMPGTETTCRAMSCSSGTMTNPAVCDGAGNCPAVSTTGCGAYACNGSTSCYTNCSSASQCAANSICSGGGQCSACPSGRAVCSNACYDINNDASHCGTACRVCAGSTPSCSGGNCVCRVKSSGNIITNPGFNTSIASWSVSGSTAFTSNDVEGCAGSGALNFVALFDSMSQCITSGIQPSTGFGFGFFYKGTNGTGDHSDYVYCEAGFYSATDCLNGYMGRVSMMVSSDGSSWVPGFVSGTVPAGTASITVHCSGAQGTGYLDQFYFSFANSPGF